MVVAVLLLVLVLVLLRDDQDGTGAVAEERPRGAPEDRALEPAVAPRADDDRGRVAVVGDGDDGLRRTPLVGDGDGLGPGNNLTEGVTVMLWDQAAREWVPAGMPDPQDPSRILVTMTQDVERFVLPEGVVPVSIRSRWPATEAQSARVDVDVIDGWLYLRSGVTL